MIMRWVIILTGAFVVQVGVLTDVQILGVHPELMLLVGICAGQVGGPERGAVLGCAAGILADIILPVPLGIAALSYAVVGFAAGVAAENVLRSSRGIQVGISALGSAAGVLLYAALGQLLGQDSLSDPRLWRIIGIVSVANALLCLPTLAVSRWAEGDGARLRHGI